jgi:hypothetical protein
MRAQLRSGDHVAGHVGHETLVASIRASHHHRVPDRLVGHETRFDLARLDAPAPDLHLVVDPAQELDVAALQMARPVPGAIQPCSRDGAEGIGHEALRGEPGPVEIAACHPGTTDVELTRYA